MDNLHAVLGPVCYLFLLTDVGIGVRHSGAGDDGVSIHHPICRAAINLMMVITLPLGDGFLGQPDADLNLAPEHLCDLSSVGLYRILQEGDQITQVAVVIKGGEGGGLGSIVPSAEPVLHLGEEALLVFSSILSLYWYSSTLAPLSTTQISFTMSLLTPVIMV